MFQSIVLCSFNIVTKTPARQGKVVLILGNSITIHPPAPDIGWFNNWGMAATAQDSDFVHRLKAKIHSKEASAVVKFKSIATFERDYKNYDLKTLGLLQRPDILILRIAENVDDTQVQSGKFLDYYNKLIVKINALKVIITDGFWPNNKVNALLRAYAGKHNFKFVELSDLSADKTNEAGTSKYPNPGVSVHPSDKGMRFIAARIWDVIKADF